MPPRIAGDIDEIIAFQVGGEVELAAIGMQGPDAENMLAQCIATTGAYQGIQYHGEGKDEQQSGNGGIHDGQREAGCQFSDDLQVGEERFQTMNKAVDGQ